MIPLILLTKKNYLLEKCNKWIKTASGSNKGTTRKRKKAQLGLVFKYFADCTNLSNLIKYADSFTIRYEILEIR